MNLKLIPPDSSHPAGLEPITVDQARSQLCYSDIDQDTDIAAMISASRSLAEMYNGRLQVLNRWELAMDCWPGSANMSPSLMPNPYFGFWPSDAYRLLVGAVPGSAAISLLCPLVSVESVKWKDRSGTDHTLVENTDYIVDTYKEPGIICPAPDASWPMAGLWPSSAIRIQFTAGRVPSVADWLAAYAAAHPSDPTPDVTPPQVPVHIVQGVKLLVSQWFTNRIPFNPIRAIAEVPFGVSALFTSDKLWL